MKRLTAFVLASAFITLAACGGGSSNPTEPTPPTETPSGPVLETRTGRVVDSVQNLQFNTATQNGRTNAQGEFTYLEGESVTFSIGDVVLPTIQAENLITPLTIFSTDSIADLGVINLTRLLQSLDVDGVPSNGLLIDDAAHASATGLTLDFNSANFDTEVVNLVANGGGVTTLLIDGESALDQLMETLANEGLISAPPEPVDTGTGGVSGCTSNSPKVGNVTEFSTLFHGVSGTLTVVDDCTLSVSNFNYDGEGPSVYFYLGMGGDYSAGSGELVGPQLSGRVYNNETVTFTIPDNLSIDDFDGVSVWCDIFLIDFGSAPL